jgi:hypothetical protein
MRVLGALLLALIIYAAPSLLQHAIGARVGQQAKAPPIVPSAPAAATIDSDNLAAPISPTLETDATQDEQIAIESQTDRQLRQIQAAQDQALDASRR